jgi:protein-disulfide isomerase
MSLGRRLFLALVVASLAGPALAAPKAAVTTLTPAGDMMLGDPKAKVEVVEYASLTCPHCAAFNRDVFAPFKAKYVDTGKVRYILKEMLTSPPEVAAAGFLTARCAGKDRYFAVVDAIFRGQEAMYAESPRAVLLRVAQQQGLTEAQFVACLGDKAAIDAIYARSQTGWENDKIEGTPTLVVNGKRIGEGEISFAQLEAALAQARKKR